MNGGDNYNVWMRASQRGDRSAELTTKLRGMVRRRGRLRSGQSPAIEGSALGYAVCDFTGSSLCVKCILPLRINDSVLLFQCAQKLRCRVAFSMHAGQISVIRPDRQL